MEPSSDYRELDLLSRTDSPRAWVMVICAFVSMFTVFGVLYSFGAFVGPMMVEFRASHQAVSTVFSTAVLIYFFLGALTGHLADRLGPRPILTAGALAMGAGMCLTALIHRLWLGYLTYGVGVGIGVGTLVVAPAAATMIERWGWRTTALLLGGFAAAAMALCAAIMERAPLSTQGRKSAIVRAVRTPVFAFLYMSWLAYVAALFITFTFLPIYATEHGATLTAGATLSGLIGLASVIARAAFGILANRFGTLRLYRLTFLLYALSFSLWLFARSSPWLVSFALAVGASYGGVVALSPAVVAQLVGLGGLGALIGTLYTAGGIGVILGPPVAGFMIDFSGSYSGAIVLAMAMAGAGFAVLTLLETKDKPHLTKLVTGSEA